MSITNDLNTVFSLTHYLEIYSGMTLMDVIIMQCKKRRRWKEVERELEKSIHSNDTEVLQESNAIGLNVPTEAFA